MQQAGIFVATVVVARVLGRTDLGVYAAATATGIAIVAGLGGGVPVLALREVAAGRADRRFVRRIEAVELSVTAAGTVLAAVVGAVLLGGRRGAFDGGIAGVGGLVLSQLGVASAVGTGLRRFRPVILAQSACGVLVAVLTSLAVAVGAGVPGAIAALALAAAAPCLWLRRQLREDLPADAGVDTSRLFYRSRVFIGIGLVYGGYQRLDSLVLLAVTSSATVGVYAAAYRILGAFSLLARGLGVVFFVRLAAAHGTDGWESLRRRGARLFWLGVLPPAAVAFAVMPWIVHLIFGAAYGDAVTPARILLLSLVPFALYYPNAHALNASFRERVLLRILIASTGLNAVLVALLGADLGARGAASAWALTELSVLLVIALVMRRTPTSDPSSRPEPLRSGDD